MKGSDFDFFLVVNEHILRLYIPHYFSSLFGIDFDCYQGVKKIVELLFLEEKILSFPLFDLVREKVGIAGVVHLNKKICTNAYPSLDPI